MTIIINHYFDMGLEKIIIIICLIIIIILLMDRKSEDKKTTNNQREINNKIEKGSDILGESKWVFGQTMPINSPKSHNGKSEKNTNTFESEAKEKVTDQDFQNSDSEVEAVDFEEEEEEFRNDELPIEYTGFATGVTFEELATVKNILQQQEELKDNVRQQAAVIVQKLQGSELYSLLEESIEGASQKIALLLDEALLKQPPISTISESEESELNDFDIGEFV